MMPVFIFLVFFLPKNKLKLISTETQFIISSDFTCKYAQKTNYFYFHAFYVVGLWPRRSTLCYRRPTMAEPTKSGRPSD